MKLVIETTAYRRTLDYQHERARRALDAARDAATTPEARAEAEAALADLPADAWVLRHVNVDDEAIETTDYESGPDGRPVVDRVCSFCGRREPCPCDVAHHTWEDRGRRGPAPAAPAYVDRPRVRRKGEPVEIPVRLTIDDYSNTGFGEAMIEIEAAPDVTEWARRAIDAIERGAPVELSADDLDTLRRLVQPVCVSAGWNGNLRTALAPAMMWGRKDPGAGDDGRGPAATSDTGL